MNTNVMFSSKTDLWETPQNLFDKYDTIYHFETDVCALPENASGLKRRSSPLRLWLCFYLREQTQNGFTICACHTERSSSCAGV